METAVRRARLTAQEEAQLYEAVLDLLCEVGYDALTMDHVAARARPSKATLYRQWGGKDRLVLEALRHQRENLEPVDTGSLRGDLLALADREGSCGLERDSGLMRALAMATRTDPELLGAVKELLIGPALQSLDRILRRAVERGEVVADCAALPYLAHALMGAFLARSLTDNPSSAQDFAAGYVHAVVLPALGV